MAGERSKLQFLMRISDVEPTPVLTRDALIQQYNVHARSYYRRADGTQTRQASSIELAVLINYID